MPKLYQAINTNKFVQIRFLEKIIEQRRDSLVLKQQESIISELSPYQSLIDILNSLLTEIDTVKKNNTLTYSQKLNSIITLIRVELILNKSETEEIDEDMLEEDKIEAEDEKRFTNTLKRLLPSKQINVHETQGPLIFLYLVFVTYSYNNEDAAQLRLLGLFFTLFNSFVALNTMQAEELNLNAQDISAIKLLEAEKEDSRICDIGID